MHAAATSRRIARISGPDPAERWNATAAPQANATQATETAFGRTPEAARRAASVLAHLAFRVASVLREAYGTSGVVIALPLLRLAHERRRSSSHPAASDSPSR